MADSASTLLIGAVGGVIAAAIQYGFRRLGESQQQRREIVETHLLQLQNSAESLYYRANNVLDWAGQSVMQGDYFVKTSAFALGRVLAHEQQLIAKGVYAKLSRSNRLKRQIKSQLHAINLGMDDQVFLHYHRIQLAEMMVAQDRLITYTEFLERWDDAKFAEPVASVRQFVQTLPAPRLERIRIASRELVALLEQETGVPSALELTAEPQRSSRAPS